jgi:LysR family transcriptional regulator, glycine cleavage system transcriptional activator
MPRPLPPLTWLRAFEAAARHRSFVAAADELGVTPSAISQQVRLLEQHLGRLLFHRLPRGIRLAEAGESYLPLVSEAFERLAIGTVEIFGQRKSHRVTVRTTVAFSVLWLAPRLARFRALHPGVELRITSSIWPAEFPDPGIDLEIRQGTGKWPGLEAERLTSDQVFPVCSPALAAGRPGLAEPADLAHHTLLHAIGFRDGWMQWLKAAGIADRVDPRRGLEFDTGVMTIELAIRGAGIALGRTCFVEDLLAGGRLVAPFSIATPTEEAFFVVVPTPRRETDVARAFREWLLTEASMGVVASAAVGGVMSLGTAAS